MFYVTNNAYVLLKYKTFCYCVCYNLLVTVKYVRLFGNAPELL